MPGPRTITSKKKEKQALSKRSGILTPEEANRKPESKKTRSSNVLKGQKFILTTGPSLQQIELSVLDDNNDLEEPRHVSMPKILNILLIVQSVLPNQYITSNLAEVFNALHDRFQTYQGKKSFEHVNRDLLAWATMKFYPKQARKILAQHNWYIPQYMLRKLFPFLISDVKWSCNSSLTNFHTSNKIG